MILDGKTIANHILSDLGIRVHVLQEKYGIRPHMAVIRVGDDPAITSYVAQKEKMAKEIGAIVSVYNHPANVTQDELLASIDFLQTQGEIHGIIVQLPLPAHLDADKLILEIHADKDVDGFRPESPFVVPLATAVLKLLEVPCMKETLETGQSYNEWLRSKKIVVIGKGKTGGGPVIDILEKRGAEVTVVDSSTTHVTAITSEADILITAVGKPEIVTKEMVKKDAILIGIGMSKNEEGKYEGDYNPEDIADKAAWYTPIPGGVGPVNVACLMENLVIAIERTMKN